MIYVCLCFYLTDKCRKILQERWTSRIYVYLYRRFDSICMKGGSEIYSFNQLFTDYKGRFVHFANTYVGDSMVAEDIAIESLMYYWENRGKLAPDSNVPAYILTVIKHKCLNYLQRLRTREEIVEYLKDCDTWELNLRIATLEACNPESCSPTSCSRLSTRRWKHYLNKHVTFLSAAATTTKAIRRSQQPWASRRKQWSSTLPRP